ncbi:hypothetical protein WICPIJ_008334 [Wickerhamomyces pijperi]|uniref:RNB domain-containing protein n=1 Tax=Wickerhamomyces pijperi TaxID=599730 RepID=A0A9P8PZ91_WICPI|nr:hypothetical protein WICPIJ_008334 [Wickerhamomyces pijperi]
MPSYHNNKSNNHQQQQQQQPSFTTSTNGKNGPREIHIAHRRSPSELTNLMMEQFALQRQLEAVQLQQQQILAQQANSNSGGLLPPVTQFNHRRTDSNPTVTHRRSQSSITGAMGSFAMPSTPKQERSSSNNNTTASPGAGQGHNRRHSLGLTEAKKAAAQVQAQRAGKENATAAGIPDLVTPLSSNTDEMPPPSGFKFPSTQLDPSSPSKPQQQHGRSRSMASPQKNFSFPPKSPSQSLSSGGDSLTVPSSTFGGHERRSSGHYRSNSRGDQNINTNWRRQQSPSRNSIDLDFTPGHRQRNSHSGSISSMAGFGGQGNNNSGNGGRKSLFAPYLPQSSIPELVNEGRLVLGTLRVNKKNRSDAYVSTDGLLDADIFICGSKDRNRALEGDLVAVELLEVDEVWSSKREKEEKKRRKDNVGSGSGSSGSGSSGSSGNASGGTGSELTSDDVHNDASTHSSSVSADSNSTPNTSVSSEDAGTGGGGGLQRRGSLKQRPTLKKNDDVEVEGQSLLLVEEEEISDEYKPLYAGHVVAVIDRIPGQLFSGTLGLLRPSQQQSNKSSDQSNNKPKIVWFKPTDKKVPLIAIPTEQAPRDFVENCDFYADRLFVASIKRWPITSLHPFGTLVSELGVMNDEEIEVDAILRDNNFLCDEFLNSDGQERTDFQLNDVDCDKRKDFTSEYVLAVSENGEWCDLSMHVKRVDKGTIELGVHVSDVTAYVKEGSSLDKNARKRSSAVVLAQKQVGLLPENILQLLSFAAGKKSLTMSVVFQIDTKDFTVRDTWVGEAFVQPKVLLNFDEIDSILADNSTVSGASKDYIKTISLISREFKRQRLHNPKLSNDVSLTLLDQIDDERIRLDLNLFQRNTSFAILNEINLRVNSHIAQLNWDALGDAALLRRLALPTSTKLDSFVKKCLLFQVDIDTSSCETLVNSILNISDPLKRQCIEILLYKITSRGKYFVNGATTTATSTTGSNGAWYFNLPLYTHFTSPLRRYADHIVHRQLKSTLAEPQEQSEGETKAKYLDQESLKMTAEYCNFKKDCAKASQDQSIHLLLSKVLNSMSQSVGQLLTEAIVLQVYESSFDVYLPEFGIEKRVHADQLPLKKCEFNKNHCILELFWEKGVDSATFIPDDELEPLSYRNSIKNKFKMKSQDIVSYLQTSSSSSSTDDVISAQLKQLNLTKPTLQTSSNSIDDYFQDLKLSRSGNDDYIQEIQTFNKVPVLLRAEIGMALPCLTVHALNPFLNE